MSRYTITSKEDLDAAVSLLLQRDAYAFDIEAQGEHRGVPHLCDVSWISLASDGITCTIPMAHPIGSRQTGTRIEPKLCADGKIRNYKKPVWEPPPPQLDRSYVFDQLRPLFLNDRQVKVAADQTVDSVAVTKYLGEVPWPPYDCVITMDWLLDENRLQHGVKPQVHDYYKYRYDKENTGRAIETFPFGQVAHYSAMDAQYEWFLYKRHLALLSADPDLAGAWQLERDLMSVLIGMRLAGADVDEDIARRHEQALTGRAEQHKAAVYRAAGTTFNMNSVPAKQDILYLPRSEGGQGLHPWKLTDGGQKKADAGQRLSARDWSTDDDVLQSYPDNDVCAALRDYGDVQKLLSTYIQAWLGTDDKPSMIHDGRIHTWFKAYGTVTGRLSSAKPNLQNVPRPDTPDGKLLRSMFTAPPGCQLIVADYGQIELVVIAHFIGHGGLYDAFMAGLDPHRNTAAGMFHIPPEQVTSRQRQLCKTSNFLISYGGGWKTLMISANKNLPPEEKITAATAREVMDLYEDTYPEVEEYRAAVMDVARSRRPPYLRTLIGRKRRMPRLNSSSPKIRSAAERAAFSALIQGCLPADTRVLTEDGWLPIGEFKDGTPVWTGERFAPASRLDKGIAPRVRLHLSDGRTFDCDDRHRLLVRGSSPWPEWKLVTELTPADELIRDHGMDWGSPFLDKEEWYWLGRMVGDGHMSVSRSVWSLAFGRTENEQGAMREFIDFLDRHMPDVIGRHGERGYSFNKHPDGSVSQVVGGTSTGVAYWQALGWQRGWKSRTKRIPSMVFRLDRPRREAFFQGYRDADGHLGTRTSKITSVNRLLLEDTLRLMQTIGLTGKISSPMVNGKGTVWYDLYIHGCEAPLTVGQVKLMPAEQMWTLSVDDERHAFSSEGLISKNSAADLMKLSLIRADNMLAEQLPDAWLALTVHDEIVAVAPEDQAEQARAIITEAMTGPEMQALIRVPLRTDAKIVDCWADAKE